MRFTRVRALGGDARATAGLGLCALREDDAVGAFVLLTEALGARAGSLEGAARTRATSALRRATARVGRVYIDPHPRDAHVMIGGEDVVVHEGAILAEAGARYLVVAVPGFALWQRPITVRAGRETRVSVTLTREGPSQDVIATLAPGTTEEDIRRTNESAFVPLPRARSGEIVVQASALGTAEHDVEPSVELVPRPPTIVGDLPDPFVRRVIRANLSRFETCVRPALREGRDGIITLGFLVDARGQTTAANVVSTTVNLARVESCFLDVVRDMRFSEALGRAPVRVTVPIALDFIR